MLVFNIYCAVKTYFLNSMAHNRHQSA